LQRFRVQLALFVGESLEPVRQITRIGAVRPTVDGGEDASASAQRIVAVPGGEVLACALDGIEKGVDRRQDCDHER
jgi:hypothetical protein